MDQNIIILDDHIIIRIVKFLCFDEIIPLYLVNRDFCKALKSRDIWKTLFDRYFPSQPIVDQGYINYEDLFKYKYQSLNFSPQIEIILHRCGLDVNKWKEHKKNKMEELEKKFQKLPISFLRFYRNISSKSLVQIYGQAGEQCFFFGGCQFYDKVTLYQLKNSGEEDQGDFYQLAQVLTLSGYRDILVDYKNRLGFGHETIFSILWRDTSQNKFTIYIMNLSLRSFLNQRAFSLEVKKSSEYYSNISFYNIVDTINRPGSDTTTNGIRIRATAKFIPFESHMNGDCYMYQIRISDNGITGHYKLVSRRWVIQDGEHTDTIEGAGVIGLYPEVQHGCQDFLYESQTLVKHGSGSMSGSFRFKNLDTNEIIEANIHPFRCQLSPEEMIVDWNKQLNSIQVKKSGNIQFQPINQSQ